MLWAIDPDVKKSGVAVFGPGGDLSWVGHVEPFKGELFWHTQKLVCEKPKIYPGVPGVDANDLVDLGEVVGWFRARVHHVEYRGHYPNDWKGGISKPVHHDRIWQVLTRSERLMFPKDTEGKIVKWLGLAPKQQKNLKDPLLELLDAAALGLFELKRVARAGIKWRT